MCIYIYIYIYVVGAGSARAPREYDKAWLQAFRTKILLSKMLEANHCRVVFHLSDDACTTYKCWICIVSRKICHTQRSMERCKRQPLYGDPTQVYHQ